MNLLAAYMAVSISVDSIAKSDPPHQDVLRKSTVKTIILIAPRFCKTYAQVKRGTITKRESFKNDLPSHVAPCTVEVRKRSV
ncbi:hypothetical protein P5673_022956 [Acropora cervicornis]|uniref:Uncharacterized protein n=1 Tax=Acropora cervicornis TaxID=6130 RepID=A0AAD9Q606_ACRCE|nr:hypothetical protein P5673_022956 [Acropora cervicornis]